jgi:hypothetical protein
MRRRVDKVEGVAWLLLKPVMGTKNKRKIEKQVHKNKRMWEGEGWKTISPPKGTH